MTGIIISMVLFPIFSVDQTSKKEFLQLFEEDSLLPSDIAGTDLYSESIDVYIAGNKSIIKQSLFSNDTNIIPI